MPQNSFTTGISPEALESLGNSVGALFDFVAILTPEGKIIALNDAARTRSGCLSGREGGFLLCPLHSPWVWELLREEGIPTALREGVWRGETALLLADGSELPVHQTLVSIGSPAQPLLASVMRDLSQAKREELARIEQANGEEAALRASGQVIFRWEPASGAMEFRGPVETLLGYPLAEMARGLEQFRARVLPEDLARLDMEWERAARGSGPLQVEFRWQCPSGRVLWLRASGTFFLDRTGRPRQLAGLLMDVTAQAGLQEQLDAARAKLEDRLQARLQEARAHAEQARKGKSELLSRMSHELRTPLNAILGFTQLLELEHPTARQTESIAHITRAGNHLLTLINETLDIARLESGRLPLQSEPVELAPFLRGIVELVRSLADRREVAVTLTGPVAGTPPHVHADPQRLRQIVLTLLSNAVKFNRAHGTVAISSGPGAAGRVRITVTDSGPGLDPEKLRGLLSASEWPEAGKNAPGGVGVGLALSRGLAHALQGELGGESELGRGSTFWVELPAAMAPFTPPSSPATTLPTKTLASSTPHKLLYVEDEELNLQLVERVLSSHPEYELLSTMQGSLALELARTHQPDLILLDLNLPDLSGEIILAQLKDDPAVRDIPVIMVTADVMGDRIERLLTGGALTYLTKPFRISEFLSIIQETISRRG